MDLNASEVDLTKPVFFNKNTMCLKTNFDKKKLYQQSKNAFIHKSFLCYVKIQKKYYLATRAFQY